MYVCECVRACVCVRVHVCMRVKSSIIVYFVSSCLSFLSVWSEEYIAIALYAVRDDDMKTRDAV